MAEERGKRYSAGETIEAIFTNEDSNGEIFDCGYDLNIIPDSKNEGKSISNNSDIQIEDLTPQDLMNPVKLKV